MKALTQQSAEPRERMLGSFSWSFAEEAGLPSSQGNLLDLSRSGMGICTITRFQQGERLKVRLEGAWRDDRVAEVRWVKQVEPALYRSGLRFFTPLD